MNQVTFFLVTLTGVQGIGEFTVSGKDIAGVWLSL
jgi:hypothetical protein